MADTCRGEKGSIQGTFHWNLNRIDMNILFKIRIDDTRNIFKLRETRRRQSDRLGVRQSAKFEGEMYAFLINFILKNHIMRDMVIYLSLVGRRGAYSGECTNGNCASDIGYVGIIMHSPQ